MEGRLTSPDHKSAMQELLRTLKPYPARRRYELTVVNGEPVFTRSAFDVEFDNAFDAALNEIFGSPAKNELGQK